MLFIDRKTTTLNTEIYSTVIIKQFYSRNLTLRYKYLYIFPNNLHQLSTISKLGFDIFFNKC